MTTAPIPPATDEDKARADRVHARLRAEARQRVATAGKRESASRTDAEVKAAYAQAMAEKEGRADG